MKKVFIAYLDENNQKIEGIFDLVSESENKIKIRSSSNIITLFSNRILKMKEQIQTTAREDKR